jgi:uncharacterized protein
MHSGAQVTEFTQPCELASGVQRKPPVRLSRFNLYVEDFPSTGTTLIYNSLTGAFLEVASEMRADLDRLDRGDLTTDDVDVDPAWLDEDAQFLVDSYAHDERAFAEWYEGMRSRTNVMQAIVSVTFACNFDCTYCCQADVLNGKTMTPAIGHDTANWLAGRAIEIGAESVDLAFVGGEPLLQKARIEQIVLDVRERLAPHGIEVYFSLITNGLFMTRDLVEKWVPLGLRGAKVTLDGDEHTHGVTRKSKKTAEETYSVIFRNIIECNDLIHISVNGNYQTDTIDGFPRLITKLREAGLKPGTPMHFSPALATLGAPSDSASGSCTFGGSNPEWMLALKDEIVRAGFDAGDPLNIGPCAFHLKHAFAIDPLGHIYKCPGFLGKTEWAIGEVASGLTGAYERMVESKPHEKSCGTCAHRPDCAGGCIAAEWIKKGQEDGINCEGEYFDRHGSDLVKRKYAFSVAASEGRDPFELIPTIEKAALDAGTRSAHARRSSALRVLAA